MQTLSLKKIKAMLLSTAQEVLAHQSKKKQPWVTCDILDFCDQRWALKKKKIKPDAASKYQKKGIVPLEKGEDTWGELD